MENVLAAVRVAPSTTEIRDFPMPEIPDDSALLKVEVTGHLSRRRPQLPSQPLADFFTIALPGALPLVMTGVKLADR